MQSEAVVAHLDCIGGLHLQHRILSSASSASSESSAAAVVDVVGAAQVHVEHSCRPLVR